MKATNNTHKYFQINICINYNVKMLYYDKIDVSEDVNVNKTSKSRECNIYHY